MAGKMLQTFSKILNLKLKLNPPHYRRRALDEPNIGKICNRYDVPDAAKMILQYREPQKRNVLTKRSNP